MSEDGASTVFVPYLPPSSALVRVHNTTAFGDKALWSGHIVFVALAIVAVAFILIARGPRRKEANLSVQFEDGESAKATAPSSISEGRPS